METATRLNDVPVISCSFPVHKFIKIALFSSIKSLKNHYHGQHGSKLVHEKQFWSHLDHEKKCLSRKTYLFLATITCLSSKTDTET